MRALCAKKQLWTLEKMNNEFLNGIKEASKKIESYTYPLLRVDGNALPDVIASCLFLKVEGSYYLITAAHALRGNQSGLLTRGNGCLIDVVGHATISRSSGKDDFDIAAVHVDEESVLKHNIKVIPESMFISDVDVSNSHSRAVSGFLASMNKQVEILNRKDKVLTGKCFTYFGHADFEGKYSIFNKNQETHVGIEFKPGTDDSGKHLSTPPWPPRGISGGGAWLIPDLSRPNLVFLEGIFIEGYKRAKKMYAFSTRLEHVIDFIGQTHNKAHVQRK